MKIRSRITSNFIDPYANMKTRSAAMASVLLLAMDLKPTRERETVHETDSSSDASPIHISSSL
jgi:hypothetical protein